MFYGLCRRELSKYLLSEISDSLVVWTPVLEKERPFGVPPDCSYPGRSDQSTTEQRGSWEVICLRGEI